MRLADFHYALPPELIARYPATERPGSRLLVIEPASALVDARFSDLARHLRAGDLLVLNDTRVIPARLLGHKESGGRVELLVDRILDEGRALAHLRSSHAPRPGTRLRFDGDLVVVVEGRAEDLFRVRFPSQRTVPEWLAAQGHVPLPPYLGRDDEPLDRERYQTVYAREEGAVAAPTAGLHFDPALLEALERHGVSRTTITLHVGAGTFQPVRTDDIAAHRLHAERVVVNDAACAAIAAARARGGRVVAVGTTSVRAVETAASEGILKPFVGETRLFLRPGAPFRVVDALITNFHLPESTLLMLVAAFGGYERVMAAYRHAVASRYRFYSYGDAMFLARPGAGVAGAKKSPAGSLPGNPPHLGGGMEE